MEYDVIIIGGSYAGISAALQLARARRKILVIDGGNRRNRFASHSHGFLLRTAAIRAFSSAKRGRSCWIIRRSNGCLRSSLRQPKG